VCLWCTIDYCRSSSLPHERYRADALVALVCGRRPLRARRSPDPSAGEGAESESGSDNTCDASPTPIDQGTGGPEQTEPDDRRPGLGRSGPSAHVVVRVDAGALRRGWLEGAEVCEIPGVGPIPVATAREILGDAFFTIVVTDGVDVRCVTGTGRTIPTRLRVALYERDPVCVVPGCGVTHHLEIDHWQRDYSMDGPTQLDNLARLCGRHHAMKTHTGWRLVGGPGKWKWVPPRVRRAASARDGPQRSSG